MMKIHDKDINSMSVPRGEEKGASGEPLEITYYDYLAISQDVATNTGIFTNQLASTYVKEYDNAILDGKAPYEARRIALQSRMFANQQYAHSNATKASQEGNIFKQKIYQNLADGYAREANQLSSDIINNEQALNEYVGGTQRSVTTKIGKLANSKFGRGILKYTGPAADAYNYTNDIIDGNWNKLGEDASSWFSRVSCG